MNWLSRLFKREKHEHDYKIRFVEQGYEFLKCTGCNMCIPSPEQEVKDKVEHDRIMKSFDELRIKQFELLKSRKP